MNNPRLLMASLRFVDCILDIQRRCIFLVQNYSSNAIKLTTTTTTKRYIYLKNWKKLTENQKLFLTEDNRKEYKLWQILESHTLNNKYTYFKE